MLAKAEPRLTKLSGYQVKYVECSGRRLSKMFPVNVVASKCFRMDCGVCLDGDGKKATLCQVKNVVYQADCMLCVESCTDKPDEGKYVGETSRTLKERVDEHRKSFNRMENKSFMLKHWAGSHPDVIEPPKFKFSVVRAHKDPLSRLVHEAVRISNVGTLNSKSEWGGYQIPRLSVEKNLCGRLGNKLLR